jgi:hypothetical protein
MIREVSREFIGDFPRAERLNSDKDVSLPGKFVTDLSISRIVIIRWNKGGQLDRLENRKILSGSANQTSIWIY